MSQLFLIMRLPKQLDQIFQLANEFDDDESDPVSMTVDECWIYTGDVAGIRKFLLSAGPSFVQCRNSCDELSDGVGVIVLDGILTDFYCQLLVQDCISDYKWAEVLEADAFSLFKEKGIFNTDVAASFRENILSKGSTEDAAVLYRNFRGHDPKPEALMEKLGLTK